MVAKKVVLTTKSLIPDQPAVRWESDGSGSYDLADGPADITRGTRIEIHLKDEAREFADPERLKAIIRKHSNFISFPIVVGQDTVTPCRPVAESKFSITPEKYKEFYEFLTFDPEEAASDHPRAVDAPVQFTATAFHPQKTHGPLRDAPRGPGLDLYVRRVLIQHEAKDLLPEFLGFRPGVVDTEDLPLNISLETLQENLVLPRSSPPSPNRSWIACKNWPRTTPRPTPPSGGNTAGS